MLSAAMLIAGCSAEDELSTQSAQKLEVMPMVNDIQPQTRASEGDNLHEKTLTSLDFKLTPKADANSLISKHYEQVKEGEPKFLGDWKGGLNLQEGSDYDFYAVANAKASYEGKSVTEMKAATQEDADIWETYTQNNQKKFLMSSLGTYTMTSASEQTIPLELVRAAAKIQLNLTTSVPNFKATEVKWKLVNYNTNTAIFDGQTAEPKIVKDDQQAPTNEMPTVGEQQYAITTYSYSTSWANNEDATKIIVSIVFKSDKDGSTLTKEYAIPVRDPEKNEKEIKRNYVYTINAEIKNINKSTDITYGDPDFMTYALTKWSDGGTTNINAGKASYLVVYPTLLIIKGSNSGDSYHDYQSIKRFSSEDAQIKDIKVWYYDKDGKKRETSLNGNVMITENPRNGVVKIESKAPENLTVKYISFKVCCGSGDTYKEQEVLVKHYPLEFIQSIEGWYSTKDIAGWIDWQRDQKEHSSYKTSSDDNFQAKVYTNSTYQNWFWEKSGTYIWDYEDDKIQKKVYQAKTSGAPNDDQSNNHMYVVQITHANDEYKIGHVTNINSKTKQSDEDVVSPAFALASQLGTVSQFNDGVKASQHCADYVEVGKNGKRYNNWRLPTAREIGVLTKYQNKNGQDVISEVMDGQYYWALNGEKVKAKDKGNAGNFVRCVRDLSVEEVEELENEREQ